MEGFKHEVITKSEFQNVGKPKFLEFLPLSGNREVEAKIEMKKK